MWRYFGQNIQSKMVFRHMMPLIVPRFVSSRDHTALIPDASVPSDLRASPRPVTRRNRLMLAGWFRVARFLIHVLTYSRDATPITIIFKRFIFDGFDDGYLHKHTRMPRACW
ncbi:MAG: hypothetical protein B7X93_07365 [Hydrogenophilales bacterium 17-61-9]|nr:MAG: hypothetical protein B7X93_07365 [Hydrogenophilales bacterium 17-61-9]